MLEVNRPRKLAPKKNGLQPLYVRTLAPCDIPICQRLNPTKSELIAELLKKYSNLSLGVFTSKPVGEGTSTSSVEMLLGFVLGRESERSSDQHVNVLIEVLTMFGGETQEVKVGANDSDSDVKIGTEERVEIEARDTDLNKQMLKQKLRQMEVLMLDYTARIRCARICRYVVLDNPEVSETWANSDHSYAAKELFWPGEETVEETGKLVHRSTYY